MKNLILVFSLVLSTAAFAGNNDPVNGDATATVESTNGNGQGIGAAMNAFRNSCPNATGQLKYVENITPCPNGGFSREILFYNPPQNCPPNQICPLSPVVIIGTVFLDCNGDVVSVTCYGI
jgi:hypothetical protein